MDKLNIIIIDDEPLARKKLEVFCAKCGNINVLGSFQSPLIALDFINNGAKIDIIFLDIRMGEISGFDFIDRLKTKQNIIITSAYEEYALKGFEYQVADYLLKPYSYDRFVKAVQKITSTPSESHFSANEAKYITIKSEHKIEKINIDTILYIEGMRDYLRIHTVEKKIMTLMNFSSIISMLPQEKFMRVHKSYIIATNRVTVISKDSVVIDDTIIPIGRSYKKEFLLKVGG